MKAGPAGCLCLEDCWTVLTACGLLPGVKLMEVMLCWEAGGRWWWWGGQLSKEKRLPGREEPPAPPRSPRSTALGPISHPSVRVVPGACGVARGTGRTYRIKGRAGGRGPLWGSLGGLSCSHKVSFTEEGTEGRGDEITGASQKEV